MTDRSKGHEADEHERGTDDEGLATTEILDHIETTKGSSEVDRAENNLGDEAVIEPGTLHDGGSLRTLVHVFRDGRQKRGDRKTYVVEKVVGACQLLQGLQNHTQNDTVEHARSSNELMPLLLLRFRLELILNLIHLLDDAVVVLGDAVELGQVGAGSFGITLAVVVTRRFGEAKHTTTQGDGEEEGQAQGDTPLAGVGEGFGTQVDAVGQEDTEGDEQLVAANNGTTNMTGSRFTYTISI